LREGADDDKSFGNNRVRVRVDPLFFATRVKMLYTMKSMNRNLGQETDCREKATTARENTSDAQAVL
jgi:hypothetical protein